MSKYLAIVAVILSIVLGITIRQKESLREKWETSAANVKAYDKLLGDSKKKSIALQLTVSQLEQFNDSVLKELNTTRKELGIKDKQLKSLQKVTSSFSRNDTVRFTDTLFTEPDLCIDTVIGDAWYSVGLGLRYPSTIAVSPEFKSEKHIVVSTRKETVNPPKKFFICRWFQRKHTVLNIDVVEKNPYVDNEETRYIEIIK